MDSALKQRLLGAAVLIALAIIFVPMFFSNSPPKQDNTTLGLSIPPAPERNFETRTLSVDAKPAAAKPAAPDPNKLATVNTGAPATFESPDPNNSAAASKPASPPPPAAPTTVTPKPTPATVPAAAPPPAPTVQNDGRYVVNLGVYADAAGAAALVAKVKKLGYPAFEESTDYQGKAAQRVRVGPYADRAAAESVRLKIKQSEEKVPSSVIDLGDRAHEAAKTEAKADTKADTKAGTKAEPGKTDAATKADAVKNAAAKPDTARPDAPVVPANRAGGYAIQLGAFKAEDEANKVRDRLRNGGVAAFIEKGKSGDQTMWKVRAGPYVDRVGADTALASIRQKFQISGIVTTQP
jgi:DedD protein